MLALDAGAQGLQLFHDGFIATIDVVNAVNDRFAFGDQGGEDKPGTGAKIGGLYRGAGKTRGTAHHGAAAVYGYARSHANHFAGMKKTVFEDCFGDYGSAFGLRS